LARFEHLKIDPTPPEVKRKGGMPRRSQFGMSGEKVPKDLGGGYARCGIEIWIEWDLTGDVHGDRVPGVNSSDELIKPYLRFPAAISCIFLDDRGDVPLAVAHRLGVCGNRLKATRVNR
jgi:hypothetical protein